MNEKMSMNVFPQLVLWPSAGDSLGSGRILAPPKL